MNTVTGRKARPSPAARETVPAAATSPASGGAAPFADASVAARRLAAAILEVLAGAQTPSEVARTLGLSLARYYQLEMRALGGLVSACEDRRKGRGGAAGSELAALRRECEQLRRQCARQQALARATRRTVGLTPLTPTAPAEGGAKRRKRRPTARALRMAALLQPQAQEPTASAAVALPMTETVAEASQPAP
jgi:hypothetical protein